MQINGINKTTDLLRRSVSFDNSIFLGGIHWSMLLFSKDRQLVLLKYQQQHFGLHVCPHALIPLIAPKNSKSGSRGLRRQQHQHALLETFRIMPTCCQILIESISTIILIWEPFIRSFE